MTDGRFRNEVVNALRVGASTVKIFAPVQDNSAVEAAGVAGHASEKEQKGIPDHFFTGRFENDKKYGLEAARSVTGELIYSLKNCERGWHISTEFSDLYQTYRTT